MCVCPPLLGTWQVHPINIALKLTKRNLMGVVGSDSLDRQTCKVQVSAELRDKLQRFPFPHMVYKNQFAGDTFGRDNPAPMHSLSILKAFSRSRKCSCWEGEFRDVAKQWQSAGMNKTKKHLAFRVPCSTDSVSEANSER